MDLINETREDELEKFNKGDEASRRNKYIALVESARVYDKKLIVRYKNSKTFVVEMFKPKGRWRQKDYQIKVAYKGSIQYTYSYSASKKSLVYVEENSNNDAFIEYYNKVSKGVIDKANELLSEVN